MKKHIVGMKFIFNINLFFFHILSLLDR